jgi:hypothetical protein
MKDGDKHILGQGIKALTNIRITTATSDNPAGGMVFAVLELTLSNGPNRTPDTVLVSVRPDELGKIAELLAVQAKKLRETLTPKPGPKH